WELEEIIDAQAPGMVGTAHVAGRNRIPLTLEADGSFSAQARFAWHEWVSGLQCAPSGTYLEDVKLEGSLDDGVMKMTMTRDAVGFHAMRRDRKSTRLNSSHVAISYAVFCL